MLNKRRLEDIAEVIRDHISITGVEQYCSETEIGRGDFIPIEKRDFNGNIFAVDGSNVVVCDWSVANLNLIRAGYSVYKASDWQRTVITYDDLFLADGKRYSEQFNRYLSGIFGLRGCKLESTELERISSYFRELQEYVALGDAIRCADPGDLVLYDGGFTWKERPLGDALRHVFGSAKKKGVDLLGVSKSSSLSWGEGIPRPFVQHTAHVGSVFAPGVPWYLSLQGKKVKPRSDEGSLEGQIYVAKLDSRCDCVFRLDAPPFMKGRVVEALGKLLCHTCSAECLGYPHALFRAHRDIRITSQEGELLRRELLDVLGRKGLTEADVRGVFLDYHDVIEMRTRRFL